MPIAQSQLPASIPDFLRTLLDSLSTGPASTSIESAGEAVDPMINFLGKPVSELFGLSLESGGPKAPQRLRLSNWDARRGVIQFHGPGGPDVRYDFTPQQLDTLLSKGTLNVTQPPDDPGLAKRLTTLLAPLMGGK